MDGSGGLFEEGDGGERRILGMIAEEGDVW